MRRIIDTLGGELIRIDDGLVPELEGFTVRLERSLTSGLGAIGVTPSALHFYIAH